MRHALATDRPFLEQMIALAAFPPGHVPPVEEALRTPHVAAWVDEWMREGDLGVVCERGSLRLGAAWCRRFAGDEPDIAGFIDPRTPVVAVAVVQGCRGQGIGTQLLERLISTARGQAVDALSLSVGRTNPALRLYERLGWKRIADEAGHPLRLRYRL
jgi:GNAT superfamily N-acetyltransferase